MSKWGLSQREQRKLWELTKHGQLKARPMAVGFLILLPLIIICVGFWIGFPEAWSEGKSAARNAFRVGLLPWEGE